MKGLSEQLRQTESSRSDGKVAASSSLADMGGEQTFASERFRQRVEARLCELGNLVSGQFPMTHRPVMKGQRNVGTYFCVHGPRSVKLTAIHDRVRNEILYYGSDGVRRESVPAA